LLRRSGKKQAACDPKWNFAGRPAVVLVALAATACAPVSVSEATRGPRYEVDASWPKPLPNRWVVGGLGGICVDANDHVLILNRQDVTEEDLNGGRLAPAIIEFDPQGNVVHAWGDPNLLDPRLHSCHFDADGNVWIASAPASAKGKPLNSPAATFFMPSSIAVDRANGDVYVSDGESPKTNHRIAVFDRDGKFLRHWLIDDMESVHCMALALDGMVYVCNRTGSEIRVYDKAGKLQRSIPVLWSPVTPPKEGLAKQTGGSAVAIDFSPDPAQRLMFVINQNNSQVEVVERETGKNLASFGRPGSAPGQFNQVHGIAVDSRGNVLLDENRGRRVHKFVKVAD
jgi:DNA-binding beta-propeller fold protein YncE